MASSNTPRAKTERLMNLTMCLLSTRRALPKARIRTLVEAYAGVSSDEAFDRMFERDKDELRELGIPLVTEEIGGYFEDEVGYRIDQRDYALPDLAFEADELAVLGLASRTWSHATLAGQAANAWRKLAARESPTETPFVGPEPHVGGAEPAFDALKDAVLAGHVVTFDYTRSGEGTSSTRTVHPWGLTSWHGRWYLTGHDEVRDAPRLFRLSRIALPVRDTGRTAESAPPDFDAHTLIRTSAATTTGESPAVLRVRVGAGHALRRRARTTGSVDEQWDLLDVDHLPGLADELASYGADVLVEQPVELRAAVVARLQAAHDDHTHDGHAHDSRPTTLQDGR